MNGGEGGWFVTKLSNNQPREHYRSTYCLKVYRIRVVLCPVLNGTRVRSSSRDKKRCPCFKTLHLTEAIPHDPKLCFEKDSERFFLKYPELSCIFTAFLQPRSRQQLQSLACGNTSSPGHADIVVSSRYWRGWPGLSAKPSASLACRV